MDIFKEVELVVAKRNAELDAANPKTDNNIIIPDEKYNGLLTPQADADLQQILKDAFGEVDLLDIEDEIDPNEDISAPEVNRELTPAQQKPVKLAPRDYQKVGIEFLKAKRRAMLTDGAGLGKTLQASMAARTPTLVIAPTYLCEQWYEFLKAQFPKTAARGQILWATGSRKKRIKAINAKTRWLVINIQMLRSFHEYFPVDHYATVIIDEAHHIRNRKSQQSRLAIKLCEDMSKRVYLLTATPIWKNPDDIWALLHCIQPDLFSDYKEFCDLFCEVTEDRYEGFKVVGVRRSMTRQLNAMLNIVRIGRTYKEVGRVLPPKIYHFLKCEFPPELQQKYNALRQYWNLQMQNKNDDDPSLFSNWGAVLVTLRMLTAWEGKVALLVNALNDCVGAAGSAPGTVFCWYKRHALMVERVLRVRFPDKKIVCITGDVPASERGRLAMDADIVVATMSSMSEGVNLYHHRSVFYFEEHYAPGAMYQSLSRIVRDRNDDGTDIEPVHVYYLHTKNTIDERIHRMMSTRTGTIKQLIMESLQD